MKVELAAEAERDLEAIAYHIATDNPARALGFILELRDKCLGLADYPRAFPVVARYAHLDVRRRVYGQYLIFYRVEAERIVVLHILHGASDYLDRLGLD
ncbi:type II toxin-antitoxin system RelE/ParE family toxin [Sphingobium sp. WCS2017Hpa-17]|uniref:type II toxin-antitoxin system RelE/ParE family toxin n=1 Tax=Sphingobium sp. WCS2017Hpa-17 TaxID=3073638 RepID=UPI002889FF4D|nr:type II toxin-antitoxin system RelE/ParE family toxin [Sphingobium sp. WCS2017Hpa-17]